MRWALILVALGFVGLFLVVPLAAVFTEQNPETQQSERYVYVKKADTAERRTVQIGISDFFFAEVQKGLAPGEVVMLEMPKEDKITVAKAPPVVRTAVVPSTDTVSRTNRVEVTRVGNGGQKPATSNVSRARGGS